MAGDAGKMEMTTSMATPVGDEDLDTLQQFIENALDLMLKGNATNYLYLIQQLSGAAGKSNKNTRRRIFQTLPRCISTMAKEPKAYHQLLDVLFKFDFLCERDEIDAYTSFIVHLVSSNTVYVLPTLQMLLRNLCRPAQLPPALAAAVAAQAKPAPAPVTVGKIAIGGSFGAPVAPVPAAPTPEPIDVEKLIKERFADVHKTLQRVLKLVPTASNALFSVVAEHFPHKRLDAPFQIAYLANVLELSTYVPGLQERIFGLIIDHLVAVDVEIKLDEKEEDVFTMDDFLDDDLLPGDGTQVDEMADKLDQMMVLMFEYIDRQVGRSSSSATLSNVEQAAQIFKFLLKVFEHSILNTHRSKYPQFLLFFTCQMDPQFQDIFISQLLTASLDPQTPPSTRHSCGAYLASFLARAKFISVSYIQKALYHLLKWMHDQMDVYDTLFVPSQPDEDSSSVDGRGGIEAEAAALEPKNGSEPGAFHESIYISTLQTVCYLICFRGLEVAQAENGYEFLRTLGWERLLITPTSYCPLAFCQQTVATEFLNFAETFDLVSEECIDQVDQAINSVGKLQKRSSKGSKSMERTAPPPSASSMMPSSTSGGSVLGLRQPLETFFPFDPYLLRRSFRFIGPLYLYWKHADPTSSENAEALNNVKEIIREYEQEAENEEDDSENEGSDDDDDDDAESLSLPGSMSYKEETRNLAISVGSSFDEGEMLYTSTSVTTTTTSSLHRKRGRKAISRTAFAPSPALSASSPPSQLPRLAGAFTLSGFDEEFDDDGF
ncbi:hypothetical protein Poli38472_011829 [Pythium oligandrum]|uniref:RNA polymerase I-specific transcription initiation factor RRN3 n=1 Tax=Pythium oligandrum TaxID=41045 RepID=A0A8K1C8A3_PYTOL|nr:hypothetical protein Poli38472_011829 [Pythium oligandrum]|eukprot:TMW58241.1 hypothetical protein Poli38472_011829 [Pythium oligandrum]